MWLFPTFSVKSSWWKHRNPNSENLLTEQTQQRCSLHCSSLHVASLINRHGHLMKPVLFLFFYIYMLVSWSLLGYLRPGCCSRSLSDRCLLIRPSLLLWAESYKCNLLKCWSEHVCTSAPSSLADQRCSAAAKMTWGLSAAGPSKLFLDILAFVRHCGGEAMAVMLWLLWFLWLQKEMQSADFYRRRNLLTCGRWCSCTGWAGTAASGSGVGGGWLTQMAIVTSLRLITSLLMYVQGETEEAGSRTLELVTKRRKMHINT